MLLRGVSKMKIIGLTGNIGSGKSLAAAYLAELGAAVIDADKVGHEIIAPGRPAYEELIQAFGDRFLREDGGIDRRALGAYIFADTGGKRLSLLNSITHPRIHERIMELIGEYRLEGRAAVVIEAALLFDSEIKGITDENWLIVAPRELLLTRAAVRDSSDIVAVAARLDAQRSEAELRALADRVVVNDSGVEEFKKRLYQAYQDNIRDA